MQCITILLPFHSIMLIDFFPSKRNQKSHVTSNLVHKLYQVQNVGKQFWTYFKKFVSKDDLVATEAKQKSRQ